MFELLYRGPVTQEIFPEVPFLLVGGRCDQKGHHPDLMALVLLMRFHCSCALPGW